MEFLPGETEKQITVQINDDTKIEDNETFYIYLIPGSGVTLTPIDRTEVTIGNDDGKKKQDKLLYITFIGRILFF